MRAGVGTTMLTPASGAPVASLTTPRLRPNCSPAPSADPAARSTNTVGNRSLFMVSPHLQAEGVRGGAGGRGVEARCVHDVGGALRQIGGGHRHGRIAVAPELADRGVAVGAPLGVEDVVPSPGLAGGH